MGGIKHWERIKAWEVNRAIVGFGLHVIGFGGFYFSFPTCRAERKQNNFSNIPPLFPVSTSPGNATCQRDHPPLSASQKQDFTLLHLTALIPQALSLSFLKGGKKISKVSKPEHPLRLQNAAPCQDGCSEQASRREGRCDPAQLRKRYICLTLHLPSALGRCLYFSINLISLEVDGGVGRQGEEAGNKNNFMGNSL